MLRLANRLSVPGCGLCSGVDACELVSQVLTPEGAPQSLCISHPKQLSKCLQDYQLDPQSPSYWAADSIKKKQTTQQLEGSGELETLLQCVILKYHLFSQPNAYGIC